MSTATRMPPPSRPAIGNGQAAARPRLGKLPAGHVAPPRVILNAVEGWGKTTYGAHAPNPAILMSRGESGYVTLRSRGLVPDCDCVELDRWADVLGQVDDLEADIGNHGSIVLDALGGFERLCHEFICARDFGNDWGEKGFGSFQKGYDVSVAEWLKLLTKLDRVRAAHGIPIVFLSHSRIRPFKNPLGADFDRYIADCHEKTWGVTHKWADAVFFGTYVTVVVDDKKTKRGKGIGGTERVLYTTRRDGYDAKNRHAMPDQIDMPDDPSSTWRLVWDAMHGTVAAASEDMPPA